MLDIEIIEAPIVKPKIKIDKVTKCHLLNKVVEESHAFSCHVCTPLRP